MGYFGIPRTINQFDVVLYTSVPKISQFDVVPLYECTQNIPVPKILLYIGKITFFKTLLSFIVALGIEIIHFIMKYVKRYVQQICF